jgi:pyruvate/2-oxoglutarate dehydrogenase complex dihydrolipoamide dehydrogenase (E3) component
MESEKKVDLLYGWASLTGPKSLVVGNKEIEGEHIYINTGTRAVAPPIKGLDKVPWLDSERLLELDTLPEHLLIIGGGYIGIEFAQVFRRFGSKVTVFQRSRQIMPQEDEEVADEIQSFLEKEGIEIHCGASAKAVEKVDDGILLTVEKQNGTNTYQGSHLLIAAGRKPNTEQLNLEKAGIKTNERGYIEVDDHGCTHQAGVFALGDVNGRGAFTHTSVNDAEVVLDHLFGGRRKLSDRTLVYGLFTDPPLGRVGMNEKQAKAAGKRILTASMPMSKISRAKEMSETHGFAKLIVDADTDLILGASILGPGGDEIINMFAAIIHSKIPCRNYRKVVLVHPTVSELMPWVLDGLQPVD